MTTTPPTMRRSRRRTPALLAGFALLLATLLPGVVESQVRAAGAADQTAVVTGVVTDTAGRPLPGARVRLWEYYRSKDVRVEVLAERTTDQLGRYRFEGQRVGLFFRVDAGKLDYEPTTDRGTRDVDQSPTSATVAEPGDNTVPTIVLPGDGVTRPAFTPDTATLSLADVSGGFQVSEVIQPDHIPYPTPVARLSYRWFVDGTQVSTGDQYVPEHADKGRRLSLRIRAASPPDWDWYTPSEITTDSVLIGGADVEDYSTPRITGIAEVGRTLTLRSPWGAGRPAGQYVVWNGGGDGTTDDFDDDSYRVTVADIGHRLSAEVLGGIHYDPQSKTTPPTAVVTKATPTLRMRLQRRPTAARRAVVRVRFSSPVGTVYRPILVRDLTTGRVLCTVTPRGDAPQPYVVELLTLAPGPHRVVAQFAGDLATREAQSAVLTLRQARRAPAPRAG